MDRVTLLLLAALASGVSGLAIPCHADSAPDASAIDRWQPLIADASARFGVPAAWIGRVMQAESGGRTMLNGRPITSSAGAMGLMQIMPETYEELRRRYGLGVDPYDPHDSVFAGAAYLRELYRRYGYPGLFAAYHAGPTRYDAFLEMGTALPVETLAYLAALGQPAAANSIATAVSSGESLFFPLNAMEPHVQGEVAPSPASGLFVPLQAVSDVSQ